MENNYLIKLKHILPFTIGKVVAVVVGYGVLRWLVTVVLGIDAINPTLTRYVCEVAVR